MELWMGLAGIVLVLSVLHGRNNRRKQRMKLQELKGKLDRGETVVLVDVRTPQEHAGGHIPGSILLPVSEVADRAGTVLKDKEAEILVYCASGARSARAARVLAGMGYTRVTNLGSIRNWPLLSSAAHH